MNSFDQCRAVEAKSNPDIIRFLRTMPQIHQGQFVITGDGNLAPFIQETVGDFLFNDHNGRLWSLEVKSEEEDKHGNFFLEYWSNLHRFTLGWLLKTQADIILYHFLEGRDLYSLSVQKLKEWAFKTAGKRTGLPGRIYDFPLRRQSKHDQLNDTWGRCVPIAVIKNEVGFTHYYIDGDEFVRVWPQEAAA